MRLRWQLGLIALVAAACASPLPRVDVDAEASTIDASDVTTGSTTASISTMEVTPMGSTSAESSTSAASTDSSGSSSGGGGLGVCSPTCAVVDDCVTQIGEVDYTCGDGYCELDGERPGCDASCRSNGGNCAEVEGFVRCVVSCAKGGSECAAVGLECIGQDDAGNGICAAPYACVDGFCEPIASAPACDPVTCDDLMIGACAEVDGVSRCTTPCTDDSMCLAGLTECIGSDDAGNSICAPIPCGGAAEGEPCNFGGIDQFGVCTGGVCICTDDAECTAQNFACNE